MRTGPPQSRPAPAARCGRERRRRSRPQGFTLVELMAVMAIASLCLTLWFGPWGQTRARAERRDAARQFVEELNAARALALRSGQPVRVSFSDPGWGLVPDERGQGESSPPPRGYGSCAFTVPGDPTQYACLISTPAGPIPGVSNARSGTMTGRWTGGAGLLWKELPARVTLDSPLIDSWQTEGAEVFAAAYFALPARVWSANAQTSGASGSASTAAAVSSSSSAGSGSNPNTDSKDGPVPDPAAPWTNDYALTPWPASPLPAWRASSNEAELPDLSRRRASTETGVWGQGALVHAWPAAQEKPRFKWALPGIEFTAGGAVIAPLSESGKPEPIRFYFKRGQLPGADCVILDPLTGRAVLTEEDEEA